MLSCGVQNDGWINPSTKCIASYVEDILNNQDCHAYGNGFNGICGQEFDTDREFSFHFISMGFQQRH